MSQALTQEPYLERDYEAIEAAVMETQRGRWFLDEFRRRNRNADTLMIVATLDRLESSLKSERPAAATAAPDIDRIRFDLADMAEAIVQTKREIARMSAQKQGGHFEEASHELDAIVSQTETATSDILNNAEKIQEIAWTLREMAVDGSICDALDVHATEIYTGCSFQDLTGQRTRKVVQVLKYLENRVNSMMKIWGVQDDRVDWGDQPDTETGDSRPDAHLLNGPQLEGRGNSQDMIDSLIVDLDAIDQTPAFSGQIPSASIDGGISDDIEIITCAPSADVPAAPPHAAVDVIEDDDLLGESGDADVFAAAPSPIAAASQTTLPATEAPAAEADVFASADVFSRSPATPRPAAVAMPVTTTIAVGNTLTTVETTVMALAETAPQLEPVIERDPLAELTPAGRLTLFG
ncbi:MAG: hypothetical protein JNM13_12775 [Hyphomicrobiaceae bacterium]|nr:hypothetical protein [Hyphomicrobiaceae bacterium]